MARATRWLAAIGRHRAAGTRLALPRLALLPRCLLAAAAALCIALPALAATNGTNTAKPPSPYLRQAQDMALKRDWPGLAQITEHWTQAEPSSAPAWTYYAVSQCHLGKPTNAERAMQREIMLAPNDPRPFEALAVCYNSLKQFDATVQAAEQAARIAPANPVVAFNLGVAWKNRAETAAKPATGAAPDPKVLQSYWLGAAEAFAHAGELKIANAGQTWMLAGGSGYRALFFPLAVRAYLAAIAHPPVAKGVRSGLAQSVSALEQACARAKSFTVGDSHILQRTWSCDGRTQTLLQQAKTEIKAAPKP